MGTPHINIDVMDVNTLGELVRHVRDRSQGIEITEDDTNKLALKLGLDLIRRTNFGCFAVENAMRCGINGVGSLQVAPGLD
ncbi:MAG: hypothetical protein JWM11_3354 [Planctomycetaceae bacterium]|nr:hypothetical protein [Planctomycetaceae bacterium]